MVHAAWALYTGVHGVLAGLVQGGMFVPSYDNASGDVEYLDELIVSHGGAVGAAHPAIMAALHAARAAVAANATNLMLAVSDRLAEVAGGSLPLPLPLLDFG